MEKKIGEKAVQHNQNNQTVCNFNSPHSFKKQYYTGFLQLVKRSMQNEVRKISKQEKNLQNHDGEKNTNDSSIDVEKNQVYQIQQQNEFKSLILYDMYGLDLELYSDLAHQIMNFDDRQLLKDYVIDLINKKKLIRTNLIYEELLDDVKEPLQVFIPLFKISIQQLIFSYSIHKSSLIQIDPKNQEDTLERLYEQNRSKFEINEFWNPVYRKKKILKGEVLSIKTRITQELKSMHCMNYLKVYKYLTSYSFPKKKTLRFHSKITNVINDYLANLKKNAKFYQFFVDFQKSYVKQKSKKITRRQQLGIQKYIKRFPLHELIEFIEENDYKDLFLQHIQKQKSLLIEKLMNPKKVEKRVLNLFIFIDIFMSLYQIISFEKSLGKILKKLKQKKCKSNKI